MAKQDIIMPKMGESITEATISKWLKKEGDKVEEDESIVEIATDKVDSEIPSPYDGVISKILYEEGETIAIGKVIAEITVEGEDVEDEEENYNTTDKEINSKEKEQEQEEKKQPVSTETPVDHPSMSESGRFYSPLVRNIAKQEGISTQELEKIPGSGKDGRVTKNDILDYIKKGKTKEQKPSSSSKIAEQAVPAVSVSGKDEIIEMDRIRSIIAQHMVESKKTSPHVNSFIEIDVTRIVQWRNKVKNTFQERENEKITFTPILIEAAVKALKDFPGINASVDGNTIIKKKGINLGMATTLPDGNLIVPVIKNAEQKNLLGMVKSVNDLANRARKNQLKPDEIQGGTFSVTNLGTFGTDFGTPIINQPQSAILALGAIKKKPVVIEAVEGDTIGIRSMMYASLAYDHRIIDGALGGLYLKKFKEYLENFDMEQDV